LSREEREVFGMVFSGLVTCNLPDHDDRCKNAIKIRRESALRQAIERLDRPLLVDQRPICFSNPIQRKEPGPPASGKSRPSAAAGERPLCGITNARRARKWRTSPIGGNVEALPPDAAR